MCGATPRAQLAFEERANASQLLRSFYESRQHEDETVTDYSHERAALVDRLESACLRHVANRDCMLRGQLVENVREPLLRWELRKRTESNPDASFIEVRDVAVRWATETDGNKRRVRVATQEVAATQEVVAEYGRPVGAEGDCRTAAATNKNTGHSPYT